MCVHFDSIVFTMQGAKYTLLREEAIVMDTRNEEDPNTQWVHLVYSLKANDNGLANMVGTPTKLNPELAPATYADEAVYDK